MQTKFNNSYTQLQLRLYPPSKNNTLQAWNAADSYLLEYLHDHFSLSDDSNLLIFNDAFGALSLALNQFKPTSITDSFLSKKAIEVNASLNKINSESINVDFSFKKSDEKYDFVLIKNPKVIDYLDDFLISIRDNLHENTIILIVGMVKNMPKTLWSLLENNFGVTKTSLTKKKAKIIELKLEKNAVQRKYPIHFIQENTQLKIYSYANVFSKNSLDIGTRFLLQNLPNLENIRTIIDLGCGNGVVGLNLALQYPNASTTFVDESFMAVESARLTCKKNLAYESQQEFILNDCLTNFNENSYDLVVCNPPFHQSHNLSIDSALKMFQQSYFVLNSGGYFIVIGNRHLPYFAHLKRIFKNCKTVANNNKFNLFMMQKNT